MNSRWFLLSCVLLAFVNGAPAAAEPKGDTQAEINYLLDFVGTSGCDFFRNGRWHDSLAARTHLAKKQNYLSKRNRISSAEDFIEKAASKSSLSGQMYEVRCGDCSAITTREWLIEELARYRVATARKTGLPQQVTDPGHQPAQH